jgi:predicted adenylyl cyclase CyaB
MARNIEIKAGIDNVENWLPKAGTLANTRPTLIAQDDTYFRCPAGRLKLRVFSTTTGELIFYERPDSAGPKESRYFIAPVTAPDQMREVLTQAYGQVGRVRKTRHLFLTGRTRIHVDRVEGLGDFLELEVVLSEDELAQAGFKEANELMVRLGVPKTSLIQGSYIDLLRQAESRLI